MERATGEAAAPAPFTEGGGWEVFGQVGPAPPEPGAAPEVARIVPRVRATRHKHPSAAGGGERSGGRGRPVFSGGRAPPWRRGRSGTAPPSARPLPVIARLRFLRSSPQTRRDRKEAAWNGGAPGPLLPRWRLPLRPDPPGWAPGSPAAFHAPDADGRGGPARRARERPRKLPLPTARTSRQAEPGPPRPPAVRATRRAAGRTSAAKPVSPSATSSTPRGTPPADPPERPAGRAAGQRPPRNKRSHPDTSFLLYCAPGENCFCGPPPALPTATPARPRNRVQEAPWLKEGGGGGVGEQGTAPIRSCQGKSYLEQSQPPPLSSPPAAGAAENTAPPGKGSCRWASPPGLCQNRVELHEPQRVCAPPSQGNHSWVAIRAMQGGVGRAHLGRGGRAERGSTLCWLCREASGIHLSLPPPPLNPFSDFAKYPKQEGQSLG